MNGLKAQKVKPRLKKHPVKVDDNTRTICSDMAIGYTKELAQDPSYINQSGRGKGKVNWKRIADECGIPYGAVFAHFNTNPERFKGSAERI